MKDVVVVGGGVVGLCVAHFLSERDWKVTIVERDRTGAGASPGNAGEICPAVATPLPAPGIVRTAIQNLYRRDSAFYVHPRALTSIAGFLVAFARRTNRHDYVRGTRSLTEFGTDTFDLLESMANSGVEARITKGDYLHVSATLESARSRLLTFKALFGDGVSSSPRALTGDSIREIEPCIGPGVGGGFLVEGQAHVDPEQFCGALRASLESKGVAILEGARVTSVEESVHEVRVHSSMGTVSADAAVITAGVGSRAVASSLGVRLPIFPGKGYSFTIRPPQAPGHVLKLEDAHVGVVPMSSGVRVAGTMEFDGHDDRFNAKRIEAIIEAAAPYLRDVDWSARTREWVGLRPMTPDGLPLIGRLPASDRVLVASGHNMLGVMLAPATGLAIALMLEGREEAASNPFDPRRFRSVARLGS